jgi:hypothetical protein
MALANVDCPVSHREEGWGVVEAGATEEGP